MKMHQKTEYEAFYKEDYPKFMETVHSLMDCTELESG